MFSSDNNSTCTLLWPCTRFINQVQLVLSCSGTFEFLVSVPFKTLPRPISQVTSIFLRSLEYMHVFFVLLYPNCDVFFEEHRPLNMSSCEKPGNPRTTSTPQLLPIHDVKLSQEPQKTEGYSSWLQRGESKKILFPHPSTSNPSASFAERSCLRTTTCITVLHNSEQCIDQSCFP